MTLETDHERIELPLEHPFTIARGTTERTENVVVRIADGEGTVGVGAAAPSAYYGETADTVEAVLPRLLDVVETVGDPHCLERIERRMEGTVGRNPAARCAVSIALHDLVGKRLGLPLYRYWGLDPDEAVETSYSIGIDDPDRMREKTERAVDRGHSVLKVKLGTGRDEEIVRTVREAAPDAAMRVDANEAWTPTEAVRKAEWLAEYDVEFVEQPVPAEDREGMRYAYEHSPLPIAVDEACETLADVPAVADRADVAVLKLMKCGSLREAVRMIHAARAHGLAVMLGCMVESSAAIAAAAHLSPLVDYADLDGSLLLAEDPYDGPVRPGGGVALDPDRPGTGARR